MAAYEKWSKTMVLALWSVALALVVIVVTQTTPRTWFVTCVSAASVFVAMTATVMNARERRRQRRWEAGHYD